VKITGNYSKKDYWDFMCDLGYQSVSEIMKKDRFIGRSRPSGTRVRLPPPPPAFAKAPAGRPSFQKATI